MKQAIINFYHIIRWIIGKFHLLFKETSCKQKKYFIHIGTVFLVIVTGISEAKAQEMGLLSEYLQVAAESNPHLKSKFNEYYAALEEVPQVGALPDPKVMFGAYILPIETRVGPRVFDVTLSQSFPWFGTLQARKDEASKRALVKYEEFLKEKNDLFFDVKEVYFQLYAVLASIGITNEYIAILERDERIALKRVEGGRTSMVDVLRIQMEMKERTSQLDFFRDNNESLKAKLNALLNRPPSSVVIVSDLIPLLTVAMEEEAMVDSMLAHNPVIKQLLKQEEAWESSVEVARKEGMPSFSLGLSYATITPRTDMEIPDNGQDMLMPMATVSIPLYRSKYRAMVKEAEFMKNSIQQELVNTQNQLLAALVQALNQYKDAQRKVELYKQLVQQARQTLNIITTAYMGGEEGYEELLRMEQQILKYQLELEYAKANQNTAVAQITRLVASELE